MYLPEDGLKPRELFCWGEKDRDFILRVKWKIELSKDIAGIEERPGRRLKGRPSKNSSKRNVMLSIPDGDAPKGD